MTIKWNKNFTYTQKNLLFWGNFKQEANFNERMNLQFKIFFKDFKFGQINHGLWTVDSWNFPMNRDTVAIFGEDKGTHVLWTQHIPVSLCLPAHRVFTRKLTNSLWLGTSLWTSPKSQMKNMFPQTKNTKNKESQH